jgi:hypothetical protein
MSSIRNKTVHGTMFALVRPSKPEVTALRRETGNYEMMGTSAQQALTPIGLAQACYMAKGITNMVERRHVGTNNDGVDYPCEYEICYDHADAARCNKTAAAIRIQLQAQRRKVKVVELEDEMTDFSFRKHNLIVIYVTKTVNMRKIIGGLLHMPEEARKQLCPVMGAVSLFETAVDGTRSWHEIMSSTCVSGGPTIPTQEIVLWHNTYESHEKNTVSPEADEFHTTQ